MLFCLLIKINGHLRRMRTDTWCVWKAVKAKKKYRKSGRHTKKPVTDKGYCLKFCESIFDTNEAARHRKILSKILKFLKKLDDTWTEWNPARRRWVYSHISTFRDALSPRALSVTRGKALTWRGDYVGSLQTLTSFLLKKLERPVNLRIR